ESGRVEPRLEGLERGPVGPAGDGPFLPLGEREEEVQRLGPVSPAEAKACGGEAGRDVEEVTRRREAFESDERLVDPSEAGE
ncbi:hypothetical protein, partial [Salmonella enterica]|uniref:hypothetical protein n=1 Tax=Salmonella enterica TaxID=28901 RepID=UPI00329746A6